MGLVDTISDLYLQKGKAQAQGQERVGQLYGSLIANLGQLPGQVQQQEQQRQAAQQEQQIRALNLQKGQYELAAAKRQDAARAAFGQIVGQAANADGTLNRQPFIDAARTNPDVAAALPEFLTNLDKAEETHNAARKSREEANQAENDQAAKFLDAAETLPDPVDQFSAFTHQMGYAASPAGGQTINPDHVIGTIAQGLGDDGNPDPQRWNALKTRIRALSSRGQAAKAEAEKIREVPPGGSVGSLTTGFTQVSAPKSTEPELASDAADDKSPTQARSKLALQLLEDAKTQTSSGELKPMRVNGKLVNTIFDPKTKKLTYQGQDVTDTAEPVRDPVEAQAASIAAQAANQARAQNFTEGQAGRKEYTDKISVPYQTALSSAQTMRDVVDAAQAGNSIAGSLQNLETAMAAIRAQGLNRINTTEIGAPASAGSLWDRIQGRIGSLIDGKAKSVPADLQKDMKEFADILEKSATVKYQKGRQSILDTYKGITLPDESIKASTSATGAPATVPAEGTKGTVNGRPAIWKTVNGKAGWYAQ